MVPPGGAEWLPQPCCTSSHNLEQKAVVGSWWASSKTCKTCGRALTAGMARHSCKACNYHLCSECATTRSREMLNEEISLTIYRASQPGLLPGMGQEEDTLEVRVPRGATVAILKQNLAELYGLPAFVQALRRDVDSPFMTDSEQLCCDDGDVLCLTTMGGGLDGLLSGLGLPSDPGKSIFDALIAATNRVSEALNAEHTLVVVLPARGGRTERRCKLVVVASARVQEVLEMAKLELDLEDDVQAQVEFAGEVLPLYLPLHVLGLQSGDTLLLRIPETTTGRSSL